MCPAGCWHEVAARPASVGAVRPTLVCPHYRLPGAADRTGCVVIRLLRAVPALLVQAAGLLAFAFLVRIEMKARQREDRSKAFRPGRRFPTCMPRSTTDEGVAEGMVDNPPIAKGSAPDNNGRRTSVRHDCVGAVEILRIQEATGELVTGKIRNISLGGCYVETQSPLERGSQLAVVLQVKNLRLRVIAEVRSVKIDGQNSAGLEFVGMTAQGLQSLQELMAELAKMALPKIPS